MLCSETMIAISPRGHQKPVQDLSIADHVYNPITGAFDEVSDILVRTVPCGLELLMPILIKKGEIFPGKPYKDVVVSPRQVVLVHDKSTVVSRGLAVLEAEARTLSSNRFVPNARTKYFAIFFDRPRFLQADGLMFRAYSPADLS